MPEKEFDARICPGNGRNSEVLSFVRMHDINQYLILDDWRFTNPELRRHQVQTDWFTRLTTRQLPAMHKILKGEILNDL